jgi:fumarylpyruvate hydrolase
MEFIRNIFCVGRNYRLHAQELGNEVPDSPMIFSKPSNAIALANRSEITFPGGLGEVHHELEVVLLIGDTYRKGKKVEELVGEMALGIDFTLRDVQSKLKAKGHPWLLAKGFKNSAVITEFHPFPGVNTSIEANFSLWKNDECIQQGAMRDMIFDLQTLINYIGENFGLRQGDLIFTGTPAGVRAIHENEHFQMKWEDEVWGEFTAKLI